MDRRTDERRTKQAAGKNNLLGIAFIVKKNGGYHCGGSRQTRPAKAVLGLDLYNERVPYYERYADVTVDETGKDLGQVVDELRAYFER